MPIPHLPDGGQSALEVAAIAQRNKLLPINIYNDAAASNQYSATHTRAVADQTTPHYGKGTGQFLDIENYNAGSDWDIQGNPTNANSQGSGRNAAFANNASTWGYDPQNHYLHPDTSKNIGQVII
jgi:hypothetical protein